MNSTRKKIIVGIVAWLVALTVVIWAKALLMDVAHIFIRKIKISVI